jgi:hypothetical protein
MRAELRPRQSVSAIIDQQAYFRGLPTTTVFFGPDILRTHWDLEPVDPHRLEGQPFRHRDRGADEHQRAENQSGSLTKGGASAPATELRLALLVHETYRTEPERVLQAIDIMKKTGNDSTVPYTDANAWYAMPCVRQVSA